LQDDATSCSNLLRSGEIVDECARHDPKVESLAGSDAFHDVSRARKRRRYLLPALALEHRHELPIGRLETARSDDLDLYAVHGVNNFTLP
jgi:hypothetical protein